MSCSAPYLKDLVSFSVNTGLRRGDVFNLKWEDVNLERASLTLIVRKNRKPHTVFLNSEAMDIIVRQRKDSEYVFTNPMTGTQIKSVRGGLEAAVKRAGIKKTTFHQFRHTVATRLLENGADIVTVKEIMGHADIKTTMRYAHTNAERQRQQMEKLGKKADGDKTGTVVTINKKVAV